MNRLPFDLPLRCQCSRVRGIARKVLPSGGSHFVCYCRDCQAFARFLDRSDVLDSAGGTNIFQMPAGRVKLVDGAKAMRCLRFRDGSVLRWYADCCRTPIANTAANPHFPVVALIHSIMDCAADRQCRDALLGPPICRIYGHSAVGPLPSNAAPPPSLRIFACRATKVVSWWIRGLGRPNPFFDDRTKAPLSVPQLLSPPADWR